MYVGEHIRSFQFVFKSSISLVGDFLFDIHAGILRAGIYSYDARTVHVHRRDTVTTFRDLTFYHVVIIILFIGWNLRGKNNHENIPAVICDLAQATGWCYSATTRTREVSDYCRFLEIERGRRTSGGLCADIYELTLDSSRARPK